MKPQRITAIQQPDSYTHETQETEEVVSGCCSQKAKETCCESSAKSSCCGESDQSCRCQ